MLGYVPGHAPRPRRRGDRIAGWPKAVAWTLAIRHLDPRRLWVRALNRFAIVEVRLGWSALTRSEIVDSDARGAVLKIEVSSTSSKTGVAHEYGCRHPAASAHDREPAPAK